KGPRLESCCGSERQIKREDRAAERIGRRFDPAAMRMNDRLDQAHTETETALGTAFVAAVKPFPDARQVLRCNTDAGVSQEQHRLLIFLECLDLDPAAAGAVLDRIIDQVGDR